MSHQDNCRHEDRPAAEELKKLTVDLELKFFLITSKFGDVITFPMILFCPNGHRHIEEEEFAEKPHHTHACQTCGIVWRPALVNTHGVKFLPGYKNGGDEQQPVAVRVTSSSPKAKVDIHCDHCGMLKSEAMEKRSETCAPPFRMQPHEFTHKHPADQAVAIPSIDLLDWLSAHRNLELVHKGPIYCDEEDQTNEWQVIKTSGSINDREFTIAGRGETPQEALAQAYAGAK